MNNYSNKKIIVTGHTGFKGSWLSIWLHMLGAKVTGISRDVPTHPSNYEACNLGGIMDDHRIDIRDTEKIKALIKSVKPDFIFHLAAQALVHESYANPLETFTSNAIGTASVLEAIRQADIPLTAIMITSDKAYDNVEWEWGYRENDRLGGKDPYSASKGMAEIAIKSYLQSFFMREDFGVRIAVTRAGNVIGGGDWAENRIIPDCMKAWSSNNSVDIRSPQATRPWQHVLEPLSGYLSLGTQLHNNKSLHGEAFNFGPPANQNHTVKELINEMSRYWDNISWNDCSNNDNQLYEARLLKLNCDKALLRLGWLPTMNFDETVRMTINWYKTFYQNDEKDMFRYTTMQIAEYTSLAVGRSIKWADGLD